MTDSQDLIREIQEHTSAHGGENTSTHLLVQAALALQRQADELAAIGAGGVTGPLIGQPQAMPDLSALTERGAKAWAGVDAQELREGFTAADMATASAQGFRDGAASLAANAGGEPVAWCQPDDATAGEAFSWPGTDKRPHHTTPLYTHPSPPEGMAAEQALLKVLAAVQRYLPPDGPSAHDTLTEIIEVVDPWPLGQLDKS